MKGIDLNAVDENGYTPLHLAVLSVEALGSTRPVRALLIRAADRTIRDNKDRKPVDLINKDMNKSLRKDLASMLVSSKKMINFNSLIKLEKLSTFLLFNTNFYRSNHGSSNVP